MSHKQIVIEKILIADEHPLYRDALKLVFEEEFSTAQIIEANSQSEVLEALDGEHKIELIVLELKLSEAEGYSCLQKLSLKTQMPPVVIISAIETPETIRASLRYGARGYLPKSSPKSVMVDAFNLVMAGGVFMPMAAIQSNHLQARSNRRYTSRTLANSLTSRQQAVLDLMSEGKANKQIADELNISELTVKAHVSAILKKLKATNRVQAVLKANEMFF